MIIIQQFPTLQINFKGTSSSNNLAINKRVLADIFSLQFVKYEGWKFNSGNYLFTTDTNYRRTINTTGAAKGILRLPHRWQRVVHNAGDYIEGQ